MPAIRLVGISGSLRKASFNTAILHSLRGLLSASEAVLEIVSLDPIPLYNQDLEADLPQSVQALRARVHDSDGVILASPEYNHGVSGVMKNVLDWLSRPQGKSVLTAKPVLTLTSSPGAMGGVRAQAQLNETLNSIAALAVLRPQIVISTVHEKLRDGQLVDQATLDFLRQGLADLLKDIRHKASVNIEQA